MIKVRKRVYSVVSVFLALLLGLSVPAGAELLFARLDGNYANATLGIVLGDGNPVHPLVSNMGGNQGQGIYPFLNAEGKFRVAVTLYTQGKADVVNIHAPGPKEGWAAPETWNRPAESVGSLRNIRSLVAMGGALFGTGYDVSQVSRLAPASGDRYVEDKTYAYVSSAPGYDAHGEGLVAYNDKLYAIFSEGRDIWTASGDYAPNHLVKLDKDLNVLEKKPMLGRNLGGSVPGAFLRQGNLLYVATLGGTQPVENAYNPASCVEIVNLDTMEISAPLKAEAVRAADPTFGHMFGAVASAWDKIYVQATKWSQADGYSIRVYETTAERLAKGDLGTLLKDVQGKNGYASGLSYDSERKYLWVGAGFSLWRYDGSGWKEFDSNALGGNLSSYAAISAPAGSLNPPAPAPGPNQNQPKSGSGGGCDTGLGWMLLLAVVPVVGRRRS